MAVRSCLLILWLLCACNPNQEIETTFDPCSPLTVVAAPGTQPEEVQGIEDAVAAWSRVLPTRIEVVTAEPGVDPGSWGPLVRFQSGDTFYRALYWDSRGEIWISREHLDPSDFAIAVAHELGHAFGLFHVPPDERPSVMNEGNLDIVPTDADADEVRALWTSCHATPSALASTPGR